jgi:hypothetical protein
MSANVSATAAALESSASAEIIATLLIIFLPACQPAFKLRRYQ